WQRMSPESLSEFLCSVVPRYPTLKLTRMMPDADFKSGFLVRFRTTDAPARQSCVQLPPTAAAKTPSAVRSSRHIPCRSLPAAPTTSQQSPKRPANRLPDCCCTTRYPGSSHQMRVELQSPADRLLPAGRNQSARSPRESHS